MKQILVREMCQYDFIIQLHAHIAFQFLFSVSEQQMSCIPILFR